ncbi:hypothetical protein QTP88_009659 [Uroleucon formosanum]
MVIYRIAQAGKAHTIAESLIKPCVTDIVSYESTDVSGLAVLIVFVRYKYQTSLEEDLLLCQPLTIYTTGYEIFNMLNIFFRSRRIDLG